MLDPRVTVECEGSKLNFFYDSKVQRILLSM